MEFKKVCMVCGGLFTTNQYQMLFCSKDCQKIYRKDRDAKYFKKNYKGTKKDTKICVVCEKIFIANHNLEKMCSDKCKYEQQLIRNKKWRNNTDYFEINKKILKKKANIAYHKNKDKISEYRKKFRKENREMLLEREKKYYQYRIKNDKLYKLRRLLRDRIKGALGKNYRKTKALDLIGCSIKYLKGYIEVQFKEGMDWSNHGFYGWHIDHIIPISHFNLEDIYEQKKAFHYTNLQPLWAFENLSKNKYML